MKIAFYGSSLLSSYWNGAATYYRGLLSDLARRGYRITFYEPDALDRQNHRDIDPPDWAEVKVYPATIDAVRAVVSEAARADVVVKASGVGVFDTELLEGVIAASRSDAIRIFWDVDAPATLAELRTDPSHPLHQAMPSLDLVLTYGGGPPVVADYRSFGARNCVPIYNALDPNTHHPVPAEDRFVADLAFLGNRLPDREARVEEFFLRPAADLPERRFLIGGNGWESKTMPPNVRSVGHVYTRDHNAFNTSPLAVLNIARDSMATTGFSPATRVFEAAGAGACLITDAWVGLDLFLKDGDEVLVARDGKDVAEHVAALTPERGAEIGRAARSRILAEHTYERRGAEVDAILRRELQGQTAEECRVKAGLQIVVLGLSLSSSWGNGHATTFRALLKACSRRGHDILFLERDVPWYAAQRDLKDPQYCELAFYSSVEDLRRFRERIAHADAVVVGSYVPDGVAVGRFVQSVARGVTAFYDIDTPVTLAKLERGDYEYLAPELIPGYDIYFSFTGGPTLELIEDRYGSPAARALYCSVDPELYPSLPRVGRWDLGYLGTYSPDRQPTLERLLLTPARQAPDLRFVVAGPQYPPDIAWPDNVERIEHVPPHEHPAFYASCRYTLNVTRADMIRAGFSPSVRLFEAAACGTPIISDNWKGLDTVLAPGREIHVAESAEAVIDALTRWPEHRREAQARAARERVLQHIRQSTGPEPSRKPLSNLPARSRESGSWSALEHDQGEGDYA